MSSNAISKFMSGIMFCAMLAFGQFQHFTGRVGASSDGNQFATDDYGASGWEVAMFAKAGAKLVHADYNDNLGSGSQLAREDKMHNSVIGAAKLWYHDTSMCYNDMDPKQRAASIANIAKQINASSPTDSFYMICAGPMEIPWRGIMASDSSKRKFTVFISHSGWNNHYSKAADSMTHTSTEMQKTGVNWRPISNQNTNFTGAKLIEFKTSPDTAVRFLYGIMPGGDISDAGMAYYVVTGLGNQLGTPADLLAWFGPKGTVSLSKSVASSSTNTSQSFDELWIFDMQGKRVGRFTDNIQKSDANISSILRTGLYPSQYRSKGKSVSAKQILGIRNK